MLHYKKLDHGVWIGLPAMVSEPLYHPLHMVSVRVSSK